MFCKDQRITLIADAAYRHTNGEVGKTLAHWAVEPWRAGTVRKYRLNKKLVSQFSGHTKFKAQIMTPALRPWFSKNKLHHNISISNSEHKQFFTVFITRKSASHWTCIKDFSILLSFNTHFTCISMYHTTSSVFQVSISIFLFFLTLIISTSQSFTFHCNRLRCTKLWWLPSDVFCSFL
jgi:hypothetical protein